MNPCPSMEETACAGESFASEPGSPAEEEAEPEAEGVESRAVSLSSEIQVSELGQQDSAERTSEIPFPSGEGPTNDSSTKISRQEKLDPGRRNALLPSRNSLPGTQSGALDNTVDSPEKVAASEDVEMGPATDAGLEDVDGHLRGGELEPEMSSAIPVEAEGVWDKASMGDLCAEMGMWADGVKPGKMEAAATTTESFKDVDPDQRPGAEPKERLLQKLSEVPILDEQFKGRFSQGDDPKDWSEASDTTGQNLHSPETREGGGRAVGKTDRLQARPALRETTVLAGALETPVPEPPENLGELISEQCLLRNSSRIPLENPVGERSVREEKRENPRNAESSNNSKEERAVPRLQDAEEMSENDDSSRGIVDVPVVGSSGGEAPGYRRGSGRERQGEFKAPPSEEESEVKRSIIGTSTAATTEDAANQPREAEGGLDKGPRGLAEQEKADSCSAADASRTRSPRPDPAERPSLGASSREGLPEGRIPGLADCSLAGTQLPSPKSHREARESLGSDSRLLLGCQDVPEDERLASLNEEGRVKTTVGGEEEEEERAGPVPSIPLAVTRRDFDPCPVQMGAWKGPCSTFSSGSSYAINQLQRPLGVDPQGPKSDIVEPENLENCSEVKGADVGGKLLYLEDPLRPDGGSEGAEAPLEQISLPVPGEPEQDALIPEGSGWSGHLAENPPCRKARASPGLTLLQPGNVAVKLPVEPMDDSADALQWPEGDDGLHWQIPASEAEGEERGRLGPSKTEGLHERRDASCFHPAEQRADGTQSREAFREPTEELATRRPCHPPIQEATAGPRKDMEMLEVSLEGPTSSHRDQGRPVRAASSPAGTEAAGASCSRKGRKRAAEAPEEPGGGEVEPDPINSAGRPANSPSESASESADDGRAACTNQGFMENTRQDLDQEASSVAGRPPGQPDTATVASPLGKAAQELPGSESSSSPPSGKGERAQKAGMALLPGQERACQLGNGPEAPAGWRGGIGCSEPCEALLQEEEKAKSPPPRKRLQQEALEGAACHPKKLCEGGSASGGGSAREPAASPGAAPPPPLPPLKGSLEQFGQTIEKFLHQCRNRLPPCSDPTDRKREAIARMVRNYFQSNVDSNEPAAETGEAGAPAGSSAREEGEGSGGPGQEDVCHFEEEPFPMEVGSALGDSGCSSPVESPKAEPPEGPLEEEPESSWPLGTSAPSQSSGPSPSPHWSHSDQALDGASGGSGSLSEAEGNSPSDGDCEDEDSGRPTKAAVLWQEDSQAEQEAPGCWLQRGEPDGGDGPDGSACREDPVEAPEETAAEGYRRAMPAKGSVFPSGGPGGPPGQDKRERAPREPFRQDPWESSPETSLRSSVAPCGPPVKMELTDEEPDGQDGRRKELPPPPSGRPPVASALGADSPEEGPSIPRPHPTPAQGAALLLVKEEAVQEDEALPSVGAESSLCAPCPSQAVELGSPGKELGRPEGGAGQAASHQAPQEAPWVPGTSASFPATDACGDGGPRSAWPLQGDGCPLGRSPLADTGLRSQAPQEEKRRLWPLLSHPPSSPPPSPSVSQHSLLPKTSADEQPEGPRPLSDFGGGALGIPCQSEEAGLAEPSDAECLRVAAAVSSSAPPQVQEGVSSFRDPPARTEPHSSRLSGRAAEWASSEQDVAFQLQECQSVLAEILQALSSVEGVDEAHVEKWRDQIAVLQKATKMPQTHIALVGNTGAGKSCLLNALLDEEAMLPTSAMRACTAVVVEIARGAEGSPYEAEVEFLSREEWNKELEALLEDMKDKAGNLKKRCPDRKTEAGAAYSRVKAVYGRVDELEKLEDKQGVTQHLGTVKHIYAETLNSSQASRDLNLQDQIRPLEEELQELERQRTEAEMEKKKLYAQRQQQRQQPVRKGSADGDSAWFQRHDILEKEFKICALQREKEARLRAISLICVQARNAFSKQRILMDFSAGLQEVSRRAEGEEDGEEEMDEGDSAGEQPANLEVFTVSSTEYLKLGGKLLCNGQPQVFHEVKDTEIPALKKFAMDTALKHSMVATEKVIRDVARVLSQMVNYLNSQRTQADARQAQVQEMLQQALQGLPALLQGVLTASSQ
ncbi:PREDICTED: uncharacterized protein LOC106546979, partial [Thamnophis sirtalis]|uniref:Uncharacterized protein LOC106546979 n=1 Tax=Thamnophis sirtalis TaxID=35019 RepID=A0A6I9XTQ1_9SAUR